MTTATPTKPAAIATGLPDVGVYVACLASYNAGRLHGAWVDLEEITDTDDIQEAIDWVLSTSPAPDAEEWAIHASSGLPACLSRSEWPDLKGLASYAEALAECTDEEEAEGYRLACDDVYEVLTHDDFRARWAGVYTSGADYAEELAQENGAIPANLPWPLNCIDWEDAWRELSHDGVRSEQASTGGVHIFRQ